MSEKELKKFTLEEIEKTVSDSRELSYRIGLSIEQLNWLFYYICVKDEEAKGIIEVLKTHIDMYEENSVNLIVGSPTQFLALQLYCENNNIEFDIYDSKGNKFEDITAAHRHANDEYINLDLFGLNLIK